MQHVPFETDIGDQFIVRLQQQFAKDGRHVGYHIFTLTTGVQHVPCYAPTANTLHASAQDYFGLLYSGWGGASSGPKQGHGKEALVWLEYLMDKDGPYQEILPYLYHDTAKEILEDKGFIFKDLAHPEKPANIGLLWSFCQATRYMYENPSRMNRFQKIAERLPTDRTLTLFLTFLINPYDDTRWTYSLRAHGEPLGCAEDCAECFLSHRVMKTHITGCAGAASCFGGPAGYRYRNKSSIYYPLEYWIEKYQRKEKHVAVAA